MDGIPFEQCEFAPFVSLAARSAVEEVLQQFDIHIRREMESKDGDDHEGEYLEELKYRRSIVTKFANDPDMKQTYALMADFADSQERTKRFILAAAWTSENYDHVRNYMKQVEKLRRSLRSKANELAALLVELEDLAAAPNGDHSDAVLNVPSSLFHMRLGRRVRTLRNREDYRFEYAGGIRRATLLEVHGGYLGVDRGYLFRPLEAVQRISMEVEKWEPWPHFFAGSASVVLRSQKATGKTQFIRSFWYELLYARNENLVRVPMDWAKTPNLIRAVAEAGTIVRNHPDDVITAADVREAVRIFEQPIR